MHAAGRVEVDNTVADRTAGRQVDPAALVSRGQYAVAHNRAVVQINGVADSILVLNGNGSACAQAVIVVEEAVSQVITEAFSITLIESELRHYSAKIERLLNVH